MFGRFPSVTVTSFCEPFDDDTVAQVRFQFHNHIKFGRRLHVIELDRINTVTSQILRALVIALRVSRERGGDVRLVCTQRGMRRVLTITGLSRVFAIHSTVKDAVGAFRELPRQAV